MSGETNYEAIITELREEIEKLRQNAKLDEETKEQLALRVSCLIPCIFFKIQIVIFYHLVCLDDGLRRIPAKKLRTRTRN